MIRIDNLTNTIEIIVTLKPTPNGKDIIGYDVHNKPVIIMSYEDYSKLKLVENEKV
jgi:hypothetical protein